MRIPRFFLIICIFSVWPAICSAQIQGAEDAADRLVYPDEVVLVAGATGRTGSLVVQQLKDLGYKRVLGMARDREAAIMKFGADTEWVVADVRDPASLERGFKGVDRVISAIGSTRDPGNGTEAVEYLGVKNMTDAALKNNVKVLVITSSAGATDESHDLNKFADNILIWKFKGEEYLRNSGLAYSIVRAGGLKPEIPGGQYGIYLGQGDDSRAGQISIEDTASVLIEAANNPEAHGKTYEIFNYVTRWPDAWPVSFQLLEKD